MTPMTRRDQLLEDLANEAERLPKRGWLKRGSDYWEPGYWTLAFLLCMAWLWTGSKLVAVFTIAATIAPAVLRRSGIRRWLEGD